MALRILALVTDAYGAGGGIAQYNRDLFGALANVDACGEVVVVTRNGCAASAGLPNKVRQLPARSGRLAFIVHALSAMHKRGPFDVIFCGHLYMAPLAALLSKATGTPLWLQIHGIEAWQRPGRLQRWAAERSHLVTSVSRHTRRLFLGWVNCPPESVKVLPNTVDERFSLGLKPDELLDRHGLRGRKVLLTVSRLAASERYKGHDRVIAAVAALRPTHPDLAYVIAGDGDDRPRLEKLVRELGLGEVVRFIGYVPDRELPNLYLTADVFVMPSTGEGFGIVFLQALASGIPVIGGDSDGSRDPLRDGMAGTLIPAHDERAIADAVKASLGKARQPGCESKAFERARFSAVVADMAIHLQQAGT